MNDPRIVVLIAVVAAIAAAVVVDNNHAAQERETYKTACEQHGGTMVSAGGDGNGHLQCLGVRGGDQS